MNITSSNAWKVIAVATGCYWMIAGWAIWRDFQTGSWMQKDGLWLALMVLTGTCGTGFWIVMAPLAIKRLRSQPRVLDVRTITGAVWCLSTIPLVLLCLGLLCMLVYFRITDH